MDAFVAAAIGFVAAALLAVVNSWLAGRENVAEEVRDRRIATYPAVWKRTGVVSRWPRTDAGRDQFLRLHEDLRHWYYGGGGLYLSTRARKRYEHLQLVLEAVLSLDEAKAADQYEAVMEAASYFRTGLTGDLETRQRSGIVVAISRKWSDGVDRRKAGARLRRATTGKVPDVETTAPVQPGRPVHAVGPKDEELTLDGAKETQ